MSKYRLINIRYPGKCHLPKLGEVNLADLPEATKEEMYNAGSPFFELTPEGRAARYPDEKVITTKKIAVKKDPEAPEPITPEPITPKAKKTTKKKK